MGTCCTVKFKGEETSYRTDKNADKQYEGSINNDETSIDTLETDFINGAPYVISHKLKVNV